MQVCLDLFRSELAEQKQTAAAASAAASEGGATASSAIAVVVGAFGWDANAEILLDRAKSVLTVALPEVAGSMPLVPILNKQGKGSVVETVLPAAMFAVAQVRFKALCRSLDGARGPV